MVWRSHTFPFFLHYRLLEIWWTLHIIYSVLHISISHIAGEFNKTICCLHLTSLWFYGLVFVDVCRCTSGRYKMAFMFIVWFVCDIFNTHMQIKETGYCLCQVSVVWKIYKQHWILIEICRHDDIAAQRLRIAIVKYPHQPPVTRFGWACAIVMLLGWLGQLPRTEVITVDTDASTSQKKKKFEEVQPRKLTWNPTIGYKW